MDNISKAKRRRPDSNRGSRICSPLPYRLATAPIRKGRRPETPPPSRVRTERETGFEPATLTLAREPGGGPIRRFSHNSALPCPVVAAVHPSFRRVSPALGTQLGHSGKQRLPDRSIHVRIDRTADLRRSRRRVGQDLGQNRLRSGPLIRGFTREHLVEHTPERVDIGARINVSVLSSLLGRHVVRRPESLMPTPGKDGVLADAAIYIYWGGVATDVGEETRDGKANQSIARGQQ